MAERKFDAKVAQEYTLVFAAGLVLTAFFLLVTNSITLWFQPDSVTVYDVKPPFSKLSESEHLKPRLLLDKNYLKQCARIKSSGGIVDGDCDFTKNTDKDFYESLGIYVSLTHRADVCRYIESASFCLTLKTSKTDISTQLMAEYCLFDKNVNGSTIEDEIGHALYCESIPVVTNKNYLIWRPVQVHASAEELADRFFVLLSRMVEKNNSFSGNSINSKHLRNRVEVVNKPAKSIDEDLIKNALLHIINLTILHDKGTVKDEFEKYYPQNISNDIDRVLKFPTLTNAFFIQRLLNGSDGWGFIQFLTFWMSWTMGLVLFCRYKMRMNKPDIFLHAFDETNLNIEKAKDLAISQAEERSAFLHSLIWLIPSLGFIGTMIGIGLSLSEAGAVITPEYVDKQSAIQNITRLLSVSFDTTLVALICSIPLTFALNSDQAKTEKLISDHANKLSSTAKPIQGNTDSFSDINEPSEKNSDVSKESDL